MFDLIAQLWTWSDTNPVYAFGALVGLAIGAFYGFDGWRGSTADMEFKDTPRMKNLLWVLGGAVAALFGDIKAMDPKSEHPRLLLYYFLSFLVMAAMVIVIWGVVVAFERVVAHRRRNTDGYELSDALGDYFFYGYRYYRERRSEARNNWQTLFFAAYSTQAAYAVAASGAVTVENRLQMAQSILQNISTVVRSYHRDSADEDKLGIRANVMILRPCNEEFRKLLRFAGESQVVDKCLALAASDRNDYPQAMALPVAGNSRDMLPGAPLAFSDEDGYDVIDDTSRINFKPGVPEAVQVEIVQYFKEQRFHSFASIKIFARRNAIGVVNVEGRVKELFGGSSEEKKRMVQLLLPFCSALGIIYADIK
jgi:hypothetical protein